MNKNLDILPVLAAIGLMALSACSGGSDTSGNNSSASNAAPHANEASPTPNVVYAQKWTNLVLLAYSSKIQLDQTGHYSTDRNGCGQDAAGSLDIGVWNPIATALNQAVASPVALPSPSPSGIPGLVSDSQDSTWFCPNTAGDNDKLSWSGGANLTVILENGSKKTILDNYLGQTCTQIADHDAAQKLYDAMNQLVILSDKTDCPNGFGY